VSNCKRIGITGALAIAGLVATARTSEAQLFPARRVVVVRAPVFAGVYSPSWLYDPWFGFGYQYPTGPFPYPYPYPYPYRYYADLGAAMRLDVKPREAEVYVDGYYAGIVNDFDGAFQRLRARPGEHEIVLYLDGYRTVRQKLYLTPKNTMKVRYAMEPLTAGEQAEARPQPASPPPLPPGQRTMPPPGRAPGGRRPPQNPASAYGALSINVQPADAEVIIDGSVWRRPDTQEPLVIEVAEGPHTIELRKTGYRSYVTRVEVRRGETTPLNVSLREQEHQR